MATKKILYIISKQLDQDLNQLISIPTSSRYLVSVILIQKGVNLNLTLNFPCFVLEDDLKVNDQPTLCSKIRYPDMVRMIFEANTVISL